jgi:hypothetical protein
VGKEGAWAANLELSGDLGLASKLALHLEIVILQPTSTSSIMRISVRSTVLKPPPYFFPPPVQHIHRLVRYQSTTPSSDAPATMPLSPRWLSDVKSRIGRCIDFGLSTEQMTEAGSVLQLVTTNWRDLLAGSEGFLTGRGRMGLYRQEVVWGEMVSPSPSDTAVQWLIRFVGLYRIAW